MKLVIATTTFFGPYQHVSDPEYRRHLYENMRRSLEQSDWKKTGWDIVVIEREDREGNWNENYRLLLRDAFKAAPLCLIADSDGYFDPDWCDWLSTMVMEFPDMAGWTLYNSPRLKQYDGATLTAEGEFERSHVGPHGLCFRTSEYIESPEGEWFESFIGELAKKGTGFLVPRISLLQHCGMYGLNNLPGASEDFDPLFPYNDVCGLPVVNPKLEVTCNAE